MKKLLLLCLFAVVPLPEAHATDIYPAQGGGLIGRADGGYLPVAVMSCGNNMACTFNRTSQTQTISVNGYQGNLNYDFPALNPIAGSLGLPCAMSRSVSIPGVEIGDFCEVSSNHGMDGGSALDTEVLLRGIAGTNVGYVQACVGPLTDGGTINLTDAGYFLFCFSRQ